MQGPGGILVARATDHIASRRIVAHAVTDERANQAATAVAGFARLQVASNRIVLRSVLLACGRNLHRIHNRGSLGIRGGVCFDLACLGTASVPILGVMANLIVYCAFPLIRLLAGM